MSMLETTDQDDLAAEAGPESLRFGHQEQAAGFVLRIAQLAAFDRFFKLFPLEGIKISEYCALVGIAENPGVRQGVLADFMKIKWSNMTKLVRSLEDMELIGRRIPPNDRRSVELYVTEKGHKLIHDIAPKMRDADREAVSMLSDEEHAQLLMLLRKVAGWPQADAAGEAAEK